VCAPLGQRPLSSGAGGPNAKPAEDWSCQTRGQRRDLLTAGFAAELAEGSGLRLGRAEGRVSESRLQPGG